MGLFTNKKMQAEINSINSALKESKKQIQAMQKCVAEGSKIDQDTLKGLFDKTNSKAQNYNTYEEQTEAIFIKYKNYTCNKGNFMVKTLIDMRSAFSLSDGLSVDCEDTDTAPFINDFITANKLNGSNLLSIVKSSEMTGKAAARFTGQYNDEGIPLIEIHFFKCGEFPVFDDEGYITEIRNNGVIHNEYESKPFANSKSFEQGFYFKIGGVIPNDNTELETTTKTGIVLTHIEYYGNALENQRHNNDVGSRITPYWQTENSGQVNQIVSFLKETGWNPGDAYIGDAKSFSYATPDSGPAENTKTELATLIKVISSVSGMPVHMLGYVDLMSNRSTAETLYTFIDMGTKIERTLIAEKSHDIILEAQRRYIINGGTAIKKVNKNFTVTIPLMDLNKLLQLVQAYSIMLNDKVISKRTYQDAIPGIDPLSEQESIANEQQQQSEKAFSDFENNLNDSEDFEESNKL